MDALSMKLQLHIPPQLSKATLVLQLPDQGSNDHGDVHRPVIYQPRPNARSLCQRLALLSLLLVVAVVPGPQSTNAMPSPGVLPTASEFVESKPSHQYDAEENNNNVGASPPQPLLPDPAPENTTVLHDQIDQQLVEPAAVQVGVSRAFPPNRLPGRGAHFPHQLTLLCNRYRDAAHGHPLRGASRSGDTLAQCRYRPLLELSVVQLRHFPLSALEALFRGQGGPDPSVGLGPSPDCELASLLEAARMVDAGAASSSGELPSGLLRACSARSPSSAQCFPFPWWWALVCSGSGQPSDPDRDAPLGTDAGLWNAPASAQALLRGQRVFVLFYVSYCPFSLQIKSYFEAVSTLFPDEIFVGVDLSQDGGAALPDFAATSVPAVVSYRVMKMPFRAPRLESSQHPRPTPPRVSEERAQPSTVQVGDQGGKPLPKACPMAGFSAPASSVVGSNTPPPHGPEQPHVCAAEPASTSAHGEDVGGGGSSSDAHPDRRPDLGTADSPEPSSDPDVDPTPRPEHRKPFSMYRSLLWAGDDDRTTLRLQSDLHVHRYLAGARVNHSLLQDLVHFVTNKASTLHSSEEPAILPRRPSAPAPRPMGFAYFSALLSAVTLVYHLHSVWRSRGPSFTLLYAAVCVGVLFALAKLAIMQPVEPV